MKNQKPKWLAQVKGDPDTARWEISIVREDNEHGRASWGWFDEDKLLISHNGGPCDWPLAPNLGSKMVDIAKKYARDLNIKEVAVDVIEHCFDRMEKGDLDHLSENIKLRYFRFNIYVATMGVVNSEDSII